MQDSDEIPDRRRVGRFRTALELLERVALADFHFGFRADQSNRGAAIRSFGPSGSPNSLDLLDLARPPPLDRRVADALRVADLANIVRTSRPIVTARHSFWWREMGSVKPT
jgi:hypothetical protein